TALYTTSLHDALPIFALDITHEQAVLVLTGHECGEAVPPRRLLRLDDLLRREVRAADEANLAGPNEIVQRTQRFLDWRLRIRLMQLVKIDPIGIESPQARLDRAHDIGARGAFELARAIHGHAEFGREHDLF